MLNQNSNTIHFTASTIYYPSKDLVPDSEGYYDFIVGGLNVYNSAGMYYVLDGAKKLFESSSLLMKRVSEGKLKGELGHPKRKPNMSKKDYIKRLLTIDEQNTCVHFKEIWLDESYGKNNDDVPNDTVAIWAKLIPSGAKADALRTSIENKNDNTAFSIRALTRDYLHNGTIYRILIHITCWDHVTEPGIKFANKWSSLNAATEDIEISISDMESILREYELDGSDTALEAAEQVNGVLEIMKHWVSIEKKSDIVKPIYTQW